MSGRSFSYGPEPGQTVDGASVEEGRGQGQGEGREGQVEEHSTQDVRLAGLRQVLVERLVSGMYELREVGGPRCTPYMQLALATELEQWEGRDRAALDSLLVLKSVQN